MVSRLTGPVAKYYVYAATQAAWFVTPVWFIFLLSKDLSYTQMGVLNAVWWAAIVLGEVPTGYLGDRIGRRNGMLLGSVTHLVAVAVFGLLNTFWSILALYAVWGVGVTFRSGSDSAWLYDTLKERMAVDQFTRVKGRGKSVRLGAAAVSSLLGGYLYRMDPYYPFLASAAVIGVGAVVVLTVPQTEQFRNENVDPFTPGDAVPVIRDTLLAPDLRTFVLALMALYAVGWGVSMFVQPIARDVALASGLPATQVEPLLGWLYAGFTAVAAGVTYFADDVREWLGIERWMRVAPVLLGGAFAVLAVVPLAAIPAFFVRSAVLETTDVLKDQYINERTASLGRATVLSAASMALAGARIPVRLALGGLGDLLDPLGAMAVAGVGLVASTLLVWRLTSKPATTAGQAVDAD